MSDDLKNLEVKFSRAGEYGTHLQKEGIKISRAAERGLETIHILKFKKDIDASAAEAWVVGANATIPAYPPANTAEIGNYYLALGTGAAAGTTIFSNIIQRLKEEYGLTEAEQKELDSYLEDFSRSFGDVGDLVKMRRGAWDTFHSATDITLMTASHAMREILTKIISQLGSNAKLQEAKEISLEEKEKKVSKRQRIKFVMFGPSSPHGAAQEMVEMASKKCYEAYTRLQEVAHGSAGEREEVLASMRITEQALLSILRFWKLRFKEK